MNPAGKRILVTGAAGFVGAYVAQSLARDGALVMGLKRRDRPYWRERCFDPALALTSCDLLDPVALEHTLKVFAPEAVFHFAAHGSYVREQQNHAEILAANVLGTYHLLAAAHKAGVARVVMAGTSLEYGPSEEPMAEDRAPAPHLIYGAAKAGATLVGSAVSASLGLPVVTLRLFSIYGPFEEPSRLIPAAILSGLDRREMPLTHGRQVHDFVFVGDLYQAFLRALEDHVPPGVYNLASGREQSVREMVEAIREIMDGALVPLWDAIPTHGTAQDHWRGDTEKAGRVLGWQADTPRREGLAQTVEWFRKHRADVPERGEIRR